MNQAPPARDLAKSRAIERPAAGAGSTGLGATKFGLFKAGRAAAPAAYDGDAAIRVGLTAREQIETRWGLILVVFMRLLAVLWILQGLLQWSLFMVPHDAIFDRLSTGQVSSIVFFAVIDFLAAVGLWLATPWGGVLWLFAAASQIFVAASVAHVFATSWVAIDAVLILVYFALTWQASRVSLDRR